MDHSGMDHGGMDHGGGHGGMDMGKGHKCNMNMLFTWDTTDLCIVFRGWHITGTLSLLLSLVAVALLCAGYEGVRDASRRYEASVAARQKIKDDGPGLPVPTTYRDDDGAAPPPPPPQQQQQRDSSSPLWWTTDRRARAAGPWTARDEKRATMVKGVLYAVQVFYSFFIMLLFMTYNGWIMLAVAVGAFVGYVVFGNATSATKSVACH